MTSPYLITLPLQLRAIAERCFQAPRIALDCEGNGLHAYRSQLCALQLAWYEGRQLAVAIVDTLALDLTPLAKTLGPDGPPKVLHDLTFDARMLADRGLRLANVRDTSVAARFLGERATGLAALVSSRLGIELEKGLQSHDWSERPFTSRQLSYLAGDVLHLLDLEAKLRDETRELDIVEEVALECHYKLWTALEPAKDSRAPHERIKGYNKLTPLQQAVLFRLCEAREEIAERIDKPPFKVASNRVLLELARKRPADQRALRQFKNRSVHRNGRRWLAAIRRGESDGEPPTPTAGPEPSPLTRREIRLRKHLDAALSNWRRAEAEARGVDIQVVLPGHCTGPVVGALARYRDDDERAVREALHYVRGLGSHRINRYGDALIALAVQASEAIPDDPDDDEATTEPVAEEPGPRPR